MADENSIDLYSKSRNLGNFGNAGILLGELVPAANPSAADIWNILIIPAGYLVTDVTLDHLLVDGASPTLDVNIGFYPVNTDDGPLAAVDDYFGADYLGLLGIARNNFFFDPIKFEQAVFLALTVNTTGANFVSARITAIVTGQVLGVK